MVVHEFRIPLPLTVDEFHRGQLYMTAEASLQESKGNEGIEWIKNEPYDNTDGHWGVSAITGTLVPRNKGQYTLKRYHFKSKLPGFAVSLLPSNATFLIEEAWNAYPHCKTVLINGYVSKEKFKIDVETMHVDNKSDLHNSLNLSPEELKQRVVEYIDIREAASNKNSNDYKPEFDPTLFKSEKTGRGPLKENWVRTFPAEGKPIMCCYKLVRADCKMFGLQTKVENAIINQQRGLFGTTLNRAYTTVDKWVELTMEDVRALEKRVADEANKSLKEASAAANAVQAV